MVVTMRANTSEERSMVKDSSSGQMVPNTKVNGVTTKCMARESSGGAMVEYTKVIIIMIRSMEMVFIRGQTVECIKVDSIMESNMAKVSISRLMALKFMVYGRKERRVLYVKTNKNSFCLKITFECLRTNLFSLFHF